MTFGEFVVRYENEILCLRKPATIRTFGSRLRLLASFLPVELSEIDYGSVQRYFTELSRSRSPKTVRNIWGTFHSVLAQAKREGLVSSIPMPVLPKVRRTPQPWYTLEELRTIIQKSDETYRVFFSLLAETGLRIGEAVGLKNSDIDLKHRTLTVNRSVYAGNTQDPKTDSAYRTLAVSSHLAAYLGGIDSNESFLFQTSQTTPWWPNEVFTRHLRPLAELNDIQPKGFHAFRRGNASIMGTLGVPEKIAATRMGHGAAGLTFGLYAQVVPGADKEWAEKIGKELFE